jgi:hypothetical protein
MEAVFSAVPNSRLYRFIPIVRDYFRPLVYFGGRLFLLPTVVAADAGRTAHFGCLLPSQCAAFPLLAAILVFKTITTVPNERVCKRYVAGNT